MHGYTSVTAELQAQLMNTTIFVKMTKLAVDKARNAWWGARAEEAERRAAVAECLGRGGSLIRELQLLGKSVAIVPLM